MPETRKRDPKQKFNIEQQERLNKLKEHAEDVEFEEIQG